MGSPRAALACVLLCCLSLSQVKGQENFVSELQRALAEIADNHYERIVAGFGNFTFAYTPFAGSFSRYLEDELATAIANTDNFELFVRDALHNLDHEFEEVYGDLFSVEGVEYLLRGRYFDEGDSVRVSLEVISFRTGNLVGKKTLVISKSALPPDVGLVPEDYARAVALDASFSEVLQAQSDNLVVRATTNRGDGAVFRTGEELIVHVFASHDAYVKVYHVDVHGNFKLIFPNRYHAGNEIPAETLLRIPAAGDNFRFVLGPPYGIEFIKVVASTSQFVDIEQSFSDLGQATRGAMTRGLAVLSSQAALAEDSISYSIAEGEGQ